MNAHTARSDDLRKIIGRSPYLSWLGLDVLELGAQSIEVKATWREDWVANPDIGQTQGGVLAALVDFASSSSLFSQMGRLAITIDLRVDYHRLAKKGDLIAKGSVIKLGRQFSVCEAQVFDLDNKLLASGRGSFVTAAPAAGSKQTRSNPPV
jgi:uncharacterized protein (TIGR00369 family)